jgi:RNA polymerase sigma factor (sigma-70 family)
MDPISDAELLAGIADGDPNWTAVYSRCRSAMYGTAAKVFRSSEDARGGESSADVVQQVLEEAKADGLPTDIDSIRRLQAHLATAVYRRAVNLTTRKSGTLEQLPQEGSSDDRLDDSFMEEVEDAIIAAQAMDLVDLLPEAQRNVIREHVLKGRSQQEVANDLGVTDARVRQHLTPGLRQLRSLLGVTITETKKGKEAKPK